MNDLDLCNSSKIIEIIEIGLGTSLKKIEMLLYLDDVGVKLNY